MLVGAGGTSRSESFLRKELAPNDYRSRLITSLVIYPLAAILECWFVIEEILLELGEILEISNVWVLRFVSEVSMR
jgi:hypothetical protein